MTQLIVIQSLILVDILIFIALLIHILLRRQGTSETRLAWIVLIILLPYLGAFIYLLLGGTNLGNRRRRASLIARKNHVLAFQRPDLEDLPGMKPQTPGPYRRIFTLAESLCDSDVLGGNALELKSNADSFLDPLIQDIQQATQHVHLLTYIYLTDEAGRRVADALAEAAGRGVACRVLVDALGSRDFLKSSLRRELTAAGVQIVEALPARLLRMLIARIDIRNHRKIVVIDNRIGYVGSQNIASPAFAPKAKYAPWVDCMVRLRGPAVHDLQELFVEDWTLDAHEQQIDIEHALPHVQADGSDVQIIGSGPGLSGDSLSLILQTCFHVASDEIILTTPYFVPDVATETAMIAAARRGIQITLIVPMRNDSKLVALASRSHYESLLSAGVRIEHFKAGLLHAKTLTVDRQFFLLGSANLDRRSLELNFEVTMLGWNPDFAGELRLLQKSYLNQSDPVLRDAWLDAPWSRRLARNAAGMLSPLL